MTYEETEGADSKGLAMRHTCGKRWSWVGFSVTAVTVGCLGTE